MATAPTTMKPRSEMREVKAPEQFQFTKQGQSIEGVLISIEPVEINGKVTREFMFALPNGDRITCLETADLKKKIDPSLIGYKLSVRYETDNSSFQKEGQSPMKIFKVLASHEKAAGF